MEHSVVVNISEQLHDLISFYIKAGEKKSHAEESEGDWNTARLFFFSFPNNRISNHYNSNICKSSFTDYLNGKNWSANFYEKEVCQTLIWTLWLHSPAV